MRATEDAPEAVATTEALGLRASSGLISAPLMGFEEASRKYTSAL